MMRLLYNLLYRFLMGGFGAFTSRPEKPAEESADDILKAFDDAMKDAEDAPEEFTEFMKMIAGAGSKPQSLTTPFEVLLTKYVDTEDKATNNSIFVEGLLSALVDLGEEIQVMVPGSEIVTSVERESEDKAEVFKGHLEWNVDTVDEMVYPISIGLLKDGFMYLKDSRSYVITIRVAK